MTVETIDPTKLNLNPSPKQGKSVTATDSAQVHIKDQIEKSGSKYLRLGASESGCNGYMYTLDFVDQPEADDHAYQLSEELTVYVRQSDLPLVMGTEIDLVKEGLNSSLKFKNPNAESHCGCGESFSVTATP